MPRARKARRPLAFEMSFQHHVGLAAVCATVVLVPLVFDPSAFFPFALPKALVAHGLAYVIVAALIGAVLSFGPRVLPRSPLHWPVGALLLAYGLATVGAADRYVALFGTDDHAVGLATIMSCATLYLGVVTFVRRRNDAIVLGVSITAGATVLLLYEAVQRVGLDPIVWSRAGAARPASLMGNATVLGQYLGTLATAGFASAALTSGVLGRTVRLALATAAIALAIGALLTESRSAVAGLGAGVALTGLALGLRLATRRARVLALSVLAAALVVGSAVTLVMPVGGPILSAASSLVGARSVAASGVGERAIIYRVALDEVLLRPIFGLGPDNFTALFGRFRPPEAFAVFATGTDVTESSAHSWLAKLLTDAGVVGLAAFGAVLFTGAWLLLRRPTLGRWVAAVSLASFLATGIVTVNDVGTEWLLWASLGVLVVESRPDGQHSITAAKVSAWTAWGVRLSVFIVVLAGALGIAGVNAWGASKAAFDGDRSVGAGRYEEAVAAARRATQADPSRARYWHLLGVAAGDLGHYADARAAFQRAVDLAPLTAVYHEDLARAHVSQYQTGDASAAAKALDQAHIAITLDGNTTQAQFTLAAVLLVTGDPTGAISATEKGFSIGKPDASEPYEVIARSFLALGRPADARLWLDPRIATASDQKKVLSLRLVLARALLQEGRQLEAVQQVSIVLSSDPQNDPAKQLLAEIMDLSR